MSVKELQDELSKYDGDLPVTTEEAGTHFIVRSVFLTEVKLVEAATVNDIPVVFVVNIY